MEVKLGRFLGRHERVHHKDGDRTNNDPSNLELHASHAEHMRSHWEGRGRNDPQLIDRVRAAAADPTVGQASLGLSSTTVQSICREHNIRWIPQGQRGRARLLTEEQVREAVRGRTTLEAARVLGVHAQTLYNRFGHLLTKRTTPGALDAHREVILDLVYRQRVPREEVAQRFGTHRVTVTKAIQRWLGRGAKPGAPDAPPRARQRGYGPRRKAPDTATQ
jgi:hypothetical protein